MVSILAPVYNLHFEFQLHPLFYDKSDKSNLYT